MFFFAFNAQGQFHFLPYNEGLASAIHVHRRCSPSYVAQRLYDGDGSSGVNNGDGDDDEEDSDAGMMVTMVVGGLRIVYPAPEA